MPGSANARNATTFNTRRSQLVSLSIVILFLLAAACAPSEVEHVLGTTTLAKQYFKDDAPWYVDNIPFFECSDKQVEAVYYYRWEMYKAHIRNVGQNKFVVTEFINHMSWDHEPYCTINAAAMHHIYEGRWLKDDRYMNGYINNLYNDGGNNHNYSESIADAAYARYLVNADSAFVISHLDSMKNDYDRWSDHWDAQKELYYIPAMPDATEYTIASVDGSGGKGGFDGGDAFRPTLNSYMYGNATAIARIAEMKGDPTTAASYLQKAAHQKERVERDLWNDSLTHFTDRFKMDNKFVHYWDFIRGRELAGFAPWYFNLPADNEKFNSAWKHATDTLDLLGKYGFRTNEPSYEYYFKQYTFHKGKRGSQWNGPSWPYQSSQVLTSMANFLNNYKQHVITNTDYMSSLRKFTLQHFLPNGKINLVENYDPNLGGPIVFFYWSNHYNHSSYNNLIITGLAGLRPEKGDSATINPLIDDSISYFCLDGVSYHGHKLTIVYDKDGTKYKIGKGLTVIVDGRKQKSTEDGKQLRVSVGKPVVTKVVEPPADIALNLAKKSFPTPSASVNIVPDSIYQAIDGKVWYFPEITNGWTTEGSTSKQDWYAVDFGETKEFNTLKLSLSADNKRFGLPSKFTVEYNVAGTWKPAEVVKSIPAQLTANTTNTITFTKVSASGLRIVFDKGNLPINLSELEASLCK